MRRLLLVIGLCLPLMVMAQGHGVQFGVRAGMGMFLSPEMNSTLGPRAGIDISYLYMARVGSWTDLGLRTGLGIGYQQNRWSMPVESHFFTMDYLNNELDYTLKASIQETGRQVWAEIPIMMALRTQGFAFNIGPKLQLAYTPYQQSLTETSVDAYYCDYDVTVHNVSAVGAFSDNDKEQSGFGALPLVQLNLSAEIGYEWRVNPVYSPWYDRYVGIQLFADYGLMSFNIHSDAPFMSVTMIESAESTPHVETGILTRDCLSRIAALNCGLRIYYTFQVVDHSGHGWHKEHK